MVNYPRNFKYIGNTVQRTSITGAVQSHNKMAEMEQNAGHLPESTRDPMFSFPGRVTPWGVLVTHALYVVRMTDSAIVSFRMMVP